MNKRQWVGYVMVLLGVISIVYWLFTSTPPLDVHPHIYYDLLKLWQVPMGDSDQAARLLSVVFGIGAIYLFYTLVSKLYHDDYMFQLVAVFFFGLSTTYLNYFTEIRSYAMLIFFSILSFYLLLVYEEKPTWRNGALLGLVNALMLWIHYYAALFLLMEFIYTMLFMRKNWKVWFDPVFLVLSVGAGVYFLAQKSRIDGMWFSSPSPWSYFSTFNYYWFLRPGDIIGDTATLWGVVFLVLAGYFIWRYFVVIKDVRDEKRFAFFLLLMFTMPPFIGLLISYFIMNVYHHRLFVMFGWAFFLLLARAVYVLYLKRDIRVFLAFGLVAIAIMAQVNYISGLPRELTSVTDKLKEMGCQFGDVVAHESPFSYVPAQYYLRGTCFKNYVYSELTPRQFASAGGDVIDASAVIKTKEGFDAFPRYFYLDHDHWLRFSDHVSVLIRETDGLNLTYEAEARKINISDIG